VKIFTATFVKRVSERAVFLTEMGINPRAIVSAALRGAAPRETTVD